MDNNAEQQQPVPGRSLGRGRGRNVSQDNQPMRRPYVTSPQKPGSPLAETGVVKISSLSVEAKEFVPLSVDAKEFIPMAQTAMTTVPSSPPGPVIVPKNSVQERLGFGRSDLNSTPMAQTAMTIVPSSPPVPVIAPIRHSVQDRLQLARQDSNVHHVMLQRQQQYLQQLSPYISTHQFADASQQELSYSQLNQNHVIPPYGQYYEGAGDYNSDTYANDPQIDLESSLMQLDYAIRTLTMNPGKFDSLIAHLMDSISPFLDDPGCCQTILKMIIDQSVNEGNFRYSGARLCTHFYTVASTTDRPDSVFRETLLEQCRQESVDQAEIWQQTVKHPSDMEKKCHGLIFFLAEMVMQVEPVASELGRILIQLMNTVLLNPAPSSAKNICQAFKLAGSTLERDPNNRDRVSEVFQNLNQLVLQGKVNSQVGEIVTSVSELRNGNWGVQPSHASAQIDNQSQSSSSLADETIYYGPDGQVITEEENRFLQESAEPNLSSQEFWEADEMDEEIAEAFEEFLEYSSNNRKVNQNNVKSGDSNSH
ncbi:hypothetical protein QAD02_009784 [Eretmocerus hayati]|uniref:Uncharacterized protein n=1 Tax=Eretmocerus hayati TaxID=131215 RepID=A0ACC2NAN4_9HYME|nr:hypothetical protein QAD02_009784 [Eretmocerus hayati]